MGLVDDARRLQAEAREREARQLAYEAQRAEAAAGLGPEFLRAVQEMGIPPRPLVKLHIQFQHPAHGPTIYYAIPTNVTGWYVGGGNQDLAVGTDGIVYAMNVYLGERPWETKYVECEPFLEDSVYLGDGESRPVRSAFAEALAIGCRAPIDSLPPGADIRYAS